jgi:hypothetical protein
MFVPPIVVLFSIYYVAISVNMPTNAYFSCALHMIYVMINLRESEAMRVLCFDPSGNFHEGKGTTGWALFVDKKLETFGAIAAEDWDSQEQYWSVVAASITDKNPDLVLIESYRLFGGARGAAQTHSQLETPQLIGYMKMVCWNAGIDVDIQNPADKARVADPQLEKMGVIEKKGRSYRCLDMPTSLHMRDAIRHGVYYFRYGKGKVK